jgi:3-deoxy-D-manno-octulosonic-acid transferase
MDNAVEIADTLSQAGGGVQVSNGEMLYQEARRLLRDTEGREKIGEVAFGILQEHQGATERNLSVLRTFLDA